MKRIACLILALMMILPLTGCGGAAEAAPETAAPETAAPAATEAAPAEEAQPRALSLGRAEGNTYTNSYLGLGITLDEDWKVYDATQIYNLPDEIANAADGEELEAATQGVDLMDVLIAKNSAGDIIQITYNRQSMASWEENRHQTEEEVVQYILADRDTVIERFKESGREVTRLEAVPVNFLGQEHTAIQRNHVQDGVTTYYVQMADFSLGVYRVMFVFQCKDVDNTREMIEQFYPLEK